MCETAGCCPKLLNIEKDIMKCVTFVYNIDHFGTENSSLKKKIVLFLLKKKISYPPDMDIIKNASSHKLINH